MARRRKSSKRTVRCTICTTHRWMGNAKGRLKAKDEAKQDQAKEEIKSRKGD